MRKAASATRLHSIQYRRRGIGCSKRKRRAADGRHSRDTRWCGDNLTAKKGRPKPPFSPSMRRLIVVGLFPFGLIDGFCLPLRRWRRSGRWRRSLNRHSRRCHDRPDPHGVVVLDGWRLTARGTAGRRWSACRCWRFHRTRAFEPLRRRRSGRWRRSLNRHSRRRHDRPDSRDIVVLDGQRLTTRSTTALCRTAWWR